RLQAALDGVPDEVIGSGPARDGRVQMGTRVEDAVPCQLLPLGPGGHGLRLGSPRVIVTTPEGLYGVRFRQPDEPLHDLFLQVRLDASGEGHDRGRGPEMRGAPRQETPSPQRARLPTADRRRRAAPAVARIARIA